MDIAKTMNTNALNSANYLPSSAGKDKLFQESSGILGKDDFLKILITQLQNQDPTAPMEDKEFIAQMAQFSALEQMTNLGKNFNNLNEGQKRTELVGLLGKEVGLSILDYQNDSEFNHEISGLVEAVNLKARTLTLKGSEYNLDNVIWTKNFNNSKIDQNE